MDADQRTWKKNEAIFKSLLFHQVRLATNKNTKM